MKKRAQGVEGAAQEVGWAHGGEGSFARGPQAHLSPAMPVVRCRVHTASTGTCKTHRRVLERTESQGRVSIGHVTKTRHLGLQASRKGREERQTKDWEGAKASALVTQVRCKDGCKGDVL